jgi:ribosomal-protein-alanine N-acetyltransferase
VTEQPVLPFTIEPMTLADLPAVVAIERVSYAMNWPMRAFEYELQHNQFAHYFVLRTSLPSEPIDPAFSKIGSESLGGQRSVVGGLVGLAGFWLMADEAHISTIAVHPDWRGLGLGEWLLLHLLEAGRTLGAAVATLEVRPSNHTALALYQKYGFEQVGRRPHYYSDNDEDALILTTPALALPDYQAMLAQHKVALFQRLVKI